MKWLLRLASFYVAIAWLILAIFSVLLCCLIAWLVPVLIVMCWAWTKINRKERPNASHVSETPNAR